MKQFWSHFGCKEKNVAGHSVKKNRKSWLAMLSLLLLLATGPSAWARSTWTVDSILDTAGSASDGDHTLRWALDQAADGDRIEFQSNLDGQTILLGSPIATAKGLELATLSGTVHLAAAPGTTWNLLQSGGEAVWDFGKITLQGAQGIGVMMDSHIATFDATVANNREGGLWVNTIGDFSGTVTGNSQALIKDSWANAVGGGVYAASITNLVGGRIADNTTSATTVSGLADASGGGMNVSLIGKAIDESSFDRNIARAQSTSGPAFAAGGGMRVDVMQDTNSGWWTFTGNKAEALSESGYVWAAGGGLYWLDSKNINAYFTGNSAIAKTGGSADAKAAGGGMYGYWSGGEPEMRAAVFEGNAASATTQAGAAYAYGGGQYARALGSADGWYIGNKAEAFSESGIAEAYGGGVYSEEVKTLSADFQGNRAQATVGNGGKAAAYGGAFAGSGDITIVGGTYQGNEVIASGADATAKGGALYVFHDGAQGHLSNITFEAFSNDILFNNNSVTVNGKTTQNDVHFFSDKIHAYDIGFTITGSKDRSVSIYGGIHSEGTQDNNIFRMTKKGDVIFNWGGDNVFGAMGGSTVSLAQGTSNVMSDFTATAVQGNLGLHLGTSHTLNLNLTGRDNTQAFFSGLASLTVEEGTHFTTTINRSEPNSSWVDLGRWLFAEGTGWNIAQLNTMGIMTSINGMWYSGGIFLSDANGLWLDLKSLTATSATPIPGAVWLLGSGLAGFAALRRRMTAA